MAQEVVHSRQSTVAAKESPGFRYATVTPPQRASAKASTNWPLAVDLDGTLLSTDLLYECVAWALKRKPWLLLLLPFWLLGGKAHLKRRLAQSVALDVATLPANEPLLAWLQKERAQGRRLHLISASDEILVRQVAERFGIFDAAQGSNGTDNLAGGHKLAVLEALYGATFTYVGDHARDVVIWQRCNSAVLVGRARALRRRLPATVEIQAIFETPRPTVQIWRRALRLHQWSKNTLLFVPALLAGRISDFGTLRHVGIGFIAFGLIASATYLFNDVLDLHEDRLHRTKRYRPLAAGTLPLRDGLVAIVALAAAAALPLVAMPPRFVGVALVYLTLTLAYSIRIKQALMLDMITLSILFSLRILAGIAAIGAPLSPWLLAFSMFFFLSLACIKRYSECMVLAAGKTPVPGRAYRASDAPWLMAMGAASAFCAVSTFFIYLVEGSSPVRLYARPQLMWLVCIILGYWLSRAWALTARGEMADDPVVFAMKDRLSLFLGGVIVLTVLLAARS